MREGRLGSGSLDDRVIVPLTERAVHDAGIDYSGAEVRLRTLDPVWNEASIALCLRDSCVREGYVELLECEAM